MKNHAHKLATMPLGGENFKVLLLKSPMTMDLATLFLRTFQPFNRI